MADETDMFEKELSGWWFPFNLAFNMEVWGRGNRLIYRVDEDYCSNQAGGVKACKYAMCSS